MKVLEMAIRQAFFRIRNYFPRAPKATPPDSPSGLRIYPLMRKGRILLATLPFCHGWCVLPDIDVILQSGPCLVSDGPDGEISRGRQVLQYRYPRNRLISAPIKRLAV